MLFGLLILLLALVRLLRRRYLPAVLGGRYLPPANRGLARNCAASHGEVAAPAGLK
ncbi:hypothetical protein ACPA9J_04470 [Pseudomonas aeruginosa]